MFDKFKKYFFPSIELNDANNKIKRKYQKLYDSNIDISNYSKFDDDVLVKLEELNKKELDKKQSIEEKGKSILIIITLSGTLLIGIVNIMLSKDFDGNFLILILIIGILYLVRSILLIIPIISTTPISDLTFDDFYDIKCLYKYQKNMKIHTGDINNDMEWYIDEMEFQEKISVIVKSIKLNQMITQIKANNLRCTLSTLKLSFRFIALFLILITFYKFAVVLNLNFEGIFMYFQNILNFLQFK
ncbi:hypothetical protein [uncultured Methanobrevibacter sp.]|jgi:hypothetical protein|uniref:hypothetical protein n=1 Tax=uncultured Methanobrevibacter sp. TaxID=253161 RepID=UPI0025E542BE|nr:hypothetical protein [uncultured Methanobrevibacter sp.]